MRKSLQPWPWIILTFALAVPFDASAASAPTLKAEREALDARITAELRARDPEALALFEQANAAGDRGDSSTARDLYARLVERLPEFTVGLRRQGWQELNLDHRASAILLIRQAVALEPSSDNLAALAACLATGDKAAAPPAAEVEEASRLAHRAVELAPELLFARNALAQTAIAAQDYAQVRRIGDDLVRMAPQEPSGYFFRALSSATTGDLSAAEASLEKAHVLGWPEAEYQSFREALQGAKPWYLRYLPIAAWILGIWLGCLLLLLVVGSLLSRAALRAAGRMPSQATGAAQGLDASLRTLYRGVLWISCLCYWLSMPIVVLLVLAVGGGLLTAIFATGHIPIKLVVIIAVLVVVTLVSVIRGLFVRGRDVDPGLPLAPDEEPRLAALLREVAGRIGTRSVDTVYLTPGTDLAVMERGGLLAQLRGGSERCLILGGGVLEGMTIGPFKAILAHEYGHFSNQDTAGGGLALAVRRSLLTTAGHLAAGGAASWYNPAWLFLIGFHKIFLRISQGASRLQEVLADRWAAFAYGAKAFEAGLLHVIRRSIRFEAHADATLHEVVEGKLALANLYSYEPSAAVDESEIETAVKKAVHREPSPYDSHPSPVRRFLWVKALGAPGEPAAGDEEPVWSLFLDREAVERRLTDSVRANVAMQGFAIPKESGGSAISDPPAAAAT